MFRRSQRFHSSSSGIPASLARRAAERPTNAGGVVAEVEEEEEEEGKNVGPGAWPMNTIL